MKITKEKLENELKFLSEIGYLDPSEEGMFSIKHNKNAYVQVKFMKNLLQSFVDTYYIVLTALISLQMK